MTNPPNYHRMSDDEIAEMIREYLFENPWETHPSIWEAVPTPAEQSTTLPSTEKGIAITGHGQREFALAADELRQATALTGEQLVPFTATPVKVEGEPREFLTDGNQVFVRLKPGETPTHLIFGELKVSLDIAKDRKTALLVGYGRGTFEGFVDRLEKNPTQHFIRWALRREGHED